MSKLDIQALSSSAHDPFSQNSLIGGKLDVGKVHVRIQQRNGRKCITLIQVFQIIFLSDQHLFFKISFHRKNQNV